MPGNQWAKLEEWLLRDWWTPSQACHLYANLIQTTNDGIFGSSPVLPEHKGMHPEQLKPFRSKKDQHLNVWQASKHDPADGEYYQSGLTEFYTKEYCIRWALKKRIEIRWLEWAIEEKFISAEELQHENKINNKTLPPDESYETAENRLLLIGLMAEMLRDKKLKPHLPFDNQARLGDYIENNFKEKYPQKGLSASKIKKVLAEANNILKRTKEN